MRALASDPPSEHVLAAVWDLLSRHPALTCWELRYHLRQLGIYVTAEEGQRLLLLRPPRPPQADAAAAPHSSWRPQTRASEQRAYWYVLGTALATATLAVAFSLGRALAGS